MATLAIQNIVKGVLNGQAETFVSTHRKAILNGFTSTIAVTNAFRALLPDGAIPAGQTYWLVMVNRGDNDAVFRSEASGPSYYTFTIPAGAAMVWQYTSIIDLAAPHIYSAAGTEIEVGIFW